MGYSREDCRTCPGKDGWGVARRGPRCFAQNLGRSRGAWCGWVPRDAGSRML